MHKLRAHEGIYALDGQKLVRRSEHIAMLALFVWKQQKEKKPKEKWDRSLHSADAVISLFCLLLAILHMVLDAAASALFCAFADLFLLLFIITPYKLFSFIGHIFYMT